MPEEWRVRVELDDERHGYGLGERLRSLDVDDEARRRLGVDAIVTRDGSHLFVYGGSRVQAEAAEEVLVELLEADELSAQIRIERWHPAERQWEDGSVPMPASPDEVAAEEAEAAARAERDAKRGRPAYDIRVDLGSLAEMAELAMRIEADGHHVRRRFRCLFVGVGSEQEAAELGKQIREWAPAGAQIHVEPTAGSMAPLVFVESHKPGIVRDLGL